MLIKEIRLQNILSFGPDTESLPLNGLNVLIGPNGSGKSNLIECIGLLQAAPKDFFDPIRKGGGILDWVWKGGGQRAGEILPLMTEGSLEVLVEPPAFFNKHPLRHGINFRGVVNRSEIDNEFVQDQDPVSPFDSYYSYSGGRGTIKSRRNNVDYELDNKSIDNQLSILAQRKDPEDFPQLFYLGHHYERIKIYRYFNTDRNSPIRIPQKTDLRNDFLNEDGSNLGLILNKLRQHSPSKKAILRDLKEIYQGVDDFDVIIEGGTVQVFIQEGDFSIPASRLSDGTLRYLCLLAVLHHPEPPSLVCIEEPELGLHPDIQGHIAKLLVEASQRFQLIVTTHSDTIVDALSHTPESVIVCEKIKGQTQMKRLNAGKLASWLEKYRLGELWASGEIGGNRW